MLPKLDLKQLAIGAAVGLTVGLLIGWVAGKHSTDSDIYSVHTLSVGGVRAIRLNKQTGETWGMDNRGNWTKMQTPN